MRRISFGIAVITYQLGLVPLIRSVRLVALLYQSPFKTKIQEKGKKDEFRYKWA